MANVCFFALAALSCGKVSEPDGQQVAATLTDPILPPTIGSLEVPRALARADSAPRSAMPSATREGRFTVVTYNVAGLPFGVSPSDPDENTPQISPLLNGYDLVAIQENFAYTRQLTKSSQHPYITQPGQTFSRMLGDGLTVLSQFPLRRAVHEPWLLCNGLLDNGTDCLAAKGVLVIEVELGDGVTVDLYDLHLDAGETPDDHRTRDAQLQQLGTLLEQRSAVRAVVVAGDWNLSADHDADDAALLAALRERAGLHDVCEGAACGPAGMDRIMYRGSSTVSLAHDAVWVDPRFVDRRGRPLSDHDPVVAAFTWQRR